MEKSHNQRVVTRTTKKTRESEVDIVAGASQTDQLEALYSNAKKDNKMPADTDLNKDEDKKDNESPATRGI